MRAGRREVRATGYQGGVERLAGGSAPTSTATEVPRSPPEPTTPPRAQNTLAGYTLRTIEAKVATLGYFTR